MARWTAASGEGARASTAAAGEGAAGAADGAGLRTSGRRVSGEQDKARKGAEPFAAPGQISWVGRSQLPSPQSIFPPLMHIFSHRLGLPV